ncbi:MAG: HAMP domain-containing sensor histidine kinase [Pseudomonas sp.]
MNGSLNKLLLRWREYVTPKQSHRKQFNLLRWFSLFSLIIIGTVALGLGYVSTQFVVNESIERDALLTAQFIHAIAAAEIRHVSLSPEHVMGDVLDTRKISRFPEETVNAQLWARGEFLDHISHLPDVLLVNVYAADRVVVWSTNSELIGKAILGNKDLEDAFSSQMPVSASYHRVDETRPEQKLLRTPEYLFIENYIPLFNNTGQDVVAMVEIYKEPKDLIERIQRGYKVIWITTAIGGGLIYIGLFWIVRRAAQLLASQQEQLLTNETYVVLGEMAASVAHSLRNPLATIRSSAELALEVVGPLAQKNINDIISQVDRMSGWVRDLLLSSSPLNSAPEPVDLRSCINEILKGFQQQLDRSQVQLELMLPDMPPVLSSRVLLQQVLHSVLTNAVESMSEGGLLSISAETNKNGREVRVSVCDTGKGMTWKQESMAFKPFYTTKRGGLGVGLVLVKRIMERFGGLASLHSREPAGVRVNLTFKVAMGGDYGAEYSGR